MALLEIKNVDISYGKRLIVRDSNLTLDKGEICSIVGESGSGKTTVIRAVLGLLAGGGRVTAGDIVYEGRSLLTLSDKEWRALRGHDISMIFQDSGAMMNQTRLIGNTYVEYIRTHEKISKKEAGCACRTRTASCALTRSSSPAASASASASRWA